MLAQMLDALTDLIYPAHCLLCQAHLPNRGTVHLCDACLEEVGTIDGPVCRKCGHPSGPYVPTERRCPNCRSKRLHFERAVAVGRYSGALKGLIWGLKFRCDPVYAVPLGRLMAEAAHSYGLLKGVQLVVPVPLHWKRRAERGFGLRRRPTGQPGRLEPPVAPHREARAAADDHDGVDAHRLAGDREGRARQAVAQEPGQG